MIGTTSSARIRTVTPTPAKLATPVSTARQRAGARLVVLSATLVACTRPYTRFEVSRRPGGLVLCTLEPDGRTTRHVLPVAGQMAPDLGAVADFINAMGLDPETGREGLYGAHEASSALSRELVRCSARLEIRNGEELLRLELPLVIREFADGTAEVYRAEAPHDVIDEPTWIDF